MRKIKFRLYDKPMGAPLDAEYEAKRALAFGECSEEMEEKK